LGGEEFFEKMHTGRGGGVVPNAEDSRTRRESGWDSSKARHKVYAEAFTVKPRETREQVVKNVT
jgi:hypothetical protein